MRGEYSDAYTRKVIENARAFYREAIRRSLLTKLPFMEVKIDSTRNPDRHRYIPCARHSWGRPKSTKRHYANTLFIICSDVVFDQQSFSNCLRVFISASMCRCGIRPDRSGGTFKSRLAPRARQMERMPTNSMTDRGASLS